MTAKLAFLVAASVAVFTVKHVTAKFTRPRDSLSKIIGEAVSADYDEEISFKKQDEKGEKNFADSNGLSGDEKKEGLRRADYPVIDNIIDGGAENNFNSISSEAELQNDRLSHYKGLGYEVEVMGSETDLERLRSLVNEMQEKQAKLEARLLQCYSLEKQSLKVGKLKKQMKIKTIESKKLNRNIDSLITDHNKLLEKSEQVDLEKKQLENAICRIKELQRKIEGDAKAKVQLQLIKNQVSVFQTGDASVRRALKSEHNLELEAISLKRKNKELQLEKRVLAIKQFAAQAKLTYFSNTSERGIISGLRTEADKLRLAREELLEQVEKLQKNRFMMIDEVVYMRWINECLHHELQIHQTSEMKKLSSKTKIHAKLLPNQKEESKCDQDSLSSTLSSDESRQCDGTILPDDSKCEETSFSKKSDLVEKLKRRRRSSAESSTLLTSENSTPRSSSLSSTSTSCTGSSIPSSPEDVTDSKNIVENGILSTSIEMQSHIKSSDTSSLKLRKRRVSFSDLVCSLDSTSPKLAWPATDMIDNDGAAFEDHRKMMASKAEDLSKTIKAEQTSKDTFIPSSCCNEVYTTRGVVESRKSRESEDADALVATNTEFRHIQENTMAPLLQVRPKNSTTEVDNNALMNIIVVIIFLLFILMYYFLLHR